MKKAFFLALGLMVGLFLISGFSSKKAAPTAKFKISKKANSIIQSKCYGCHSPQGRSDKAKAKLQWDDLAGLSSEEQLSKLQKIQTVLEEGSMPPSKFLERMPDKKLTDKEKASMQKWASKTVKKLAP